MYRPSGRLGGLGMHKASLHKMDTTTLKTFWLEGAYC